MEPHLLGCTPDLLRSATIAAVFIPMTPNLPALAEGAAEENATPTIENTAPGPEALYAAAIAAGDRLIDALRAESGAWLALFKEHQRGSLDEMRRARSATDALSARYAAAIQQLTEQTRD